MRKSDVADRRDDVTSAFWAMLAANPMTIDGNHRLAAIRAVIENGVTKDSPERLNNRDRSASPNRQKKGRL